MTTKVLFQATGRRKNSVARVYLSPGKGTIQINGRSMEDYLCRASLGLLVEEPLKAVDLLGDYAIEANVKGGGLTGQAGAVRLGIARALLQINSDFRPKLKEKGLLTRDARKVERKKYGQPGARKRFQFSKR